MMDAYLCLRDVRLTLQDHDDVPRSTVSTSILTEASMVGSRKTRTIAEVLERRGFTTTIVERKFDGDLKRREVDEPSILVCGVDNPVARAELEESGFALVVEAGIGSKVTDFRAMQVNTFPGPRKARAVWGGMTVDEAVDISAPAYGRLAEQGLDVCGLERLAGTAVSVPFVGAVAGTLMLAQILRLLAGDRLDRDQPRPHRAPSPSCRDERRPHVV